MSLHGISKSQKISESIETTLSHLSIVWFVRSCQKNAWEMKSRTSECIMQTPHRGALPVRRQRRSLHHGGVLIIKWLKTQNKPWCVTFDTESDSTLTGNMKRPGTTPNEAPPLFHWSVSRTALNWPPATLKQWERLRFGINYNHSATASNQPTVTKPECRTMKP